MVSAPQAQILLVNPDGVKLYDAIQGNLNATNSGNTELVAAVAGKRIRVVSIILTNGGSATITTKCQSATTDITAAHMLASDGGGYTQTAVMGAWLFQTAAGEALNLNLSANGTVACDVVYVQV